MLAVATGGLLAGRWGNLSFHLHHYMWAAVLSFFMRYDSDVSVISQAVALGIFNQELCGGTVHTFFDRAATIST